MTAVPPTITLLNQIEVLHATRIFPNTFATLEWYMVAAFETTLTRENGKISINKTTFWVSPDKNPKGMGTIAFDMSDTLGDNISNDLFTAACGSDADQTIMIGYAKNQEQVEQALRHHATHGMKGVAFTGVGERVTPRALRAAKRGGKRGGGRK